MLRPIIYFFCFLFLVFADPVATAQDNDEHYSVFILGNFTDISSDSQITQHLTDLLSSHYQGATVLINGDMVSGNGLEPANEELDQLRALVDIFQAFPEHKLVFLPGDRDWKKSKAGGYEYYLQLEEAMQSYINESGSKNVLWPIENGCAGPKTLLLDFHVSLIALNTQWWNHPYDKPRPSDAVCDPASVSAILEEFKDELESNRDKNVLIAGHYPLLSFGKEGGYFPFPDHLKPIPIIGSFNVAYRSNIGGPEDLSNKYFQEFFNGMRSELYDSRNLVYAGGHGRNQQLIREGENYCINSGAWKKATPVSRQPGWMPLDNVPGLVEVKYYYDGTVGACIHSYGTQGFVTPMKEILLFKTACSEIEDDRDVPKNMEYVPCLATPKEEEASFIFPSDSAFIAAGPEYQASWIKRFFLGDHYRDTWTTPVKAPYLNLRSEQGGLTPLERGGGRQTISLKFLDPQGNRYTFRSVNKDPIKALAYYLRQSLAVNIARDQTSTQHPYGALAIPSMLEQINILHATPQLFVMPDDPALGPYRSRFSGMMGLLEEHPGDRNYSGDHYFGADEIQKSEKLFGKLYKDHSNHVHTREFIRARIFDMLVGDWSKHEDNWKWAGFNSDEGVIYRPIPRDRDHVFSSLDGIIPWLADREWGIQNLETFNDRLKGLKSLMYQARHMDRFLASEASLNDWIEEAKYIQRSLTIEEIDQATQAIPKEVSSLSTETIKNKLQTRYDDLEKYARSYYKILAKEVDVVGSHKPEYFAVSRIHDGSLTVQAFALSDSSEIANRENLLYERTFFPEETREVRIYGLNGNDIFRIKGPTDRGIRLRVFGGNDSDRFIDSSPEGRYKFYTRIYDLDPDTRIDKGPGSIIASHWNQDLFEYNRTRFKYDRYRPILSLGIDQFNGVQLRGGINFTLQRFGKPEYASKHSIIGGISSFGNLSLDLRSYFRQALHEWDMTLNIHAAQPQDYNFFFGIGNDTEKVESLFEEGYYEARHNQISIEGGLVRQFLEKSKFSLLVGYERNNPDQPQGSILAENSTEVVGAQESIDLAPFKVGLNLDFRDKSGLPTNGAKFTLDLLHALSLEGNNETFGMIKSTVELHASNRWRRKLTLSIRAGGAHGYGEIPYYKLFSLGSDSGLRGFFRNRFTGNSALYVNSELRILLGQVNTFFVPVAFGTKVFFDSGKVSEGLSDFDRTWHSGYGFGLFMVPIDESFTLNLSFGFSKEETLLPLFSIGTPLR